MTDSGSRFVRISVLFLTILCSLLPSFLTAQTPEQTYEFALFQKRQGNYDIAIKSLKRIQFFDELNNFPGVFKLLADSYFEQAKYEDAYYYYDLASMQSVKDSLFPDIVARKVTCKLFNHNYQEALIELLSFDDSVNAYQQKEFDLLFGITYFYLANYNESERYFLKCAETIQPQIADVNKGFVRIKRLEKRYNPAASRVMSIVIPGSGQMWAGDYRNGANSLLLISALFAASVSISGTLSLFDSFFIVGPWFQRYYMGGYHKAYEITRVKQQNEKNKVLAQMVHLLNQPYSQ